MSSRLPASSRCTDRERRLAAVKFMALPLDDELLLAMQANDTQVREAFASSAGRTREPSPVSRLLEFVFRVFRRPWAARS